MYPIELPEHWQIAKNHSLLSDFPDIKQWVCSESSLTIKIKELGVAFSVEVLSQSYRSLDKSMQSVINTGDSVALVREVVLKQGDVPLVYAQTLMPESTIIGTEKRLSDLGNQSLGQILFQSNQAIRDQIECAVVENDSPLALFIEDKLKQSLTKTCFIRRSLFHLDNKPILVNECFLPALVDGY